MRGTALVLTVAFVFASSGVLFGHAAAQEPSPMPPEECCQQPPTDATLSGTVLDEKGAPVAGATVSASHYGPVYYAEESDSGDGSSSSSMRPCCYSGHNSTVTGADGRYSLGVWAGEMQVYVHRDGFASASAQVKAESGQTATQDFTLKAFPAKTAHIVGKVVDAKSGKGLGFASLNVRSPWYGLHECSWTDADRANYGGSGSSNGSAGSAEPAPAKDAAVAMPYPYYDPGCAISMHEDGSFEGYVTPGYAIVSAYAWQDCATSRDADGSSSTTCGPEFLPWTRTLTLPANETTRLDIRLPSRPAPDSTVSGYLVDVETGKAIPGATISFSNQETYAYGTATTDQDGSYSLRLRSGYHTVSVWSQGYLSWEGVLQVAKGSTPYDVQLTPGQDSWGGCCIAYGMETKAGAAEPAPMVASGEAASDMAADDGAMREAGGTAEQYQDLGGGLGPYNPAERKESLVDTDPGSQQDGKGAPGAGLLLTGLAVGLALIALRRRKA